MAVRDCTTPLGNEQSPRAPMTRTSMDWQLTHPVDFSMAERVRFALQVARVYPTRPMTEDGDAFYVANVRATLHALADVLTPTDAVAVYRVARLLCLPTKPTM